MKTTYLKILEAYQLVMRMRGTRMRMNVSRGLFDLKRLLQPHFEFYAEEEEKIISSYGGKVAEDGTGTILIDDPEKKAQCTKERMELMQTEVEVKIEKKPVIHDADLQEISWGEMEILEPYFDFQK